MVQKKSLSPRKVPKQRRSRQKVEQILAAATRILETEGLEGFNTNAIAEAANMSIGSLYQYFPDKDTITAQLIVRHTAAFLSQLEQAICHTESQQASSAQQKFEAKIQRLIAIAVEQQLARPQLARLLDREEARLPLNQETQETQGKILALIAQLFEVIDSGCRAVVVQDVLAIARGMIDTAGAAKEQDAKALEKRVLRAVLGYVNSYSPAYENRP